MRASVLAGCQQAAVLPQGVPDEIHGTFGRVDPVPAVQQAPGNRHAADHQSVPRGEYLVIAAGTDALFAGGEQLTAGRVDPRVNRCRIQCEILRQLPAAAEGVQVPLAREIGRSVEAEVA